MVDEMKPVHPVAPRPRWPFTRRQIIAQIIVAAVILASGIGIGVGGTILSLRDRIMWRFPPRGGPPRFDPNEDINRWRTELGLSDDQAQQIRDVFTKRHTAFRQRLDEMFQVQQVEREEFVASMKSILTPDQFQKWEHEVKERERHFRQWRPDGFKGPGGPGGPGGPDRRGRPDRQGGPSRPGGPDGHRDRGSRDMRGQEPPPPDGPAPDSPPPQ
jgi:Spy/CpxP family protein refolding chaperone